MHRRVKYLNNVIEADHGKLKQLIRPVRGFKTLKTAYATIMGFEVMARHTQGPGGDLPAELIPHIRSRRKQSGPYRASLLKSGDLKCLSRNLRSYQVCCT